MSERKSAELREHRLLAAVVEQLDELVFVTDAAGVIEYVNPGFERATGYAEAEVLGQRASTLGHPDSGAAGLDAMLAAVRAGERWRGRLVLRAEDGTALQQDATVAPVAGAADAPTRFVYVGRDIGREIELEQQLQLAQRMEAIGRLAGGVAHDFNNLLAVILCNADFLGDELGPDDPLREDLDAIRAAGHRAESLTRQLLAFSRRQILRPRPLEVNEIVSEVDKMLRRLLGEHIALALVLGEGLDKVEADPAQIEQVLLNLAVNARDAMPDGGKLTIETSAAFVTEQEAAHWPEAVAGRHVCIAVSDTGSGMDAATLERAFEPFFTTKEMGRGSGLGLSTVYGIVVQSGGHLRANSRPGEGSRFEIYLPELDRPRAAAITSSTAPRRREAEAETILVVEDEQEVRRVAVRVLGKHGYRVLEAPDGAAALRLVEQHAGPIDLMLTDVVMPGLSGRQLADRLAERRPEMKVVYMSGFTDDPMVRRGVIEAERAFIEKPFTPASLAQRIRRILEQADGDGDGGADSGA